MSFEEFLRQAVALQGEVRLVPRVSEDNEVFFYAHVNGKDSETVDFRVSHDDIYNLRG